ncbi:hypothetical protein WN944_007707 [Citrus x changshan-huyou]|uniref:Uncharacterized protein n=1 Tax=Citrus x changshan-huyou TaxID=2935761 RepID=A0AAP0QUI7_9ROSI
MSSTTPINTIINACSSPSLPKLHRFTPYILSASKENLSLSFPFSSSYSAFSSTSPSSSSSQHQSITRVSTAPVEYQVEVLNQNLKGRLQNHSMYMNQWNANFWKFMFLAGSIFLKTWSVRLKQLCEPELGEIYPLVGSANRLGLIDPEMGECLPAAMLLPYCGRTIGQGHCNKFIGLSMIPKVKHLLLASLALFPECPLHLLSPTLSALGSLWNWSSL